MMTHSALLLFVFVSQHTFSFSAYIFLICSIQHYYVVLLFSSSLSWTIFFLFICFSLINSNLGYSHTFHAYRCKFSLFFFMLLECIYMYLTDFFWHYGSVYVLLSLGCHKNQRLLLGGIMFSDFWNQSWSHYKWNREKTIFCFYSTLNIFLTCTCLINPLWNDNHLFSQNIHVKFDYIQGTNFFISNNFVAIYHIKLHIYFF